MEIARDFTLLLQNRLQENPRFIQVILGPRQVGKTTGVLQIAKTWQDRCLYASADEEIAPSGAWLQSLWVAARKLAPPALLIIDEIQSVPNWSGVVKGLWDNDRRNNMHLHIVILGSSSLRLHQGLSESLAGRFELIAVPHWTLYESTEAFNWELDTFLTFGGYPGSAELLPDTDRWQQYMVQSIIEPVITRDILATQRITKPALLRQIFELILEYPSQVVSYQKLLGQLQEGGNAATAKQYCQLLADAFLIGLLPKFSTRALSSRTSSPKLVPLAPALVHAIVKHPVSDPIWRGRLLESAVIAAILRSGFPVSYWNEGSSEVDAIVAIDGCPLALEIKSGRKRRTESLNAFRSKFPSIPGLLITPQRAHDILMARDIKGFLRGLLP